jgi:hypothetical protein
MKRNNQYLLVIGLLVYILGMVASLTFNVLVLWANLEGQSFWGYPEALSFDSSLTAEARLGRLTCPMIITPGEVGHLELKVRNPNNYPIEAWISAHISKPGETEGMIRELTSVPLEPGESSKLSWQVSSENVISRPIVQTRVFLRLTKAHPPARTKHCGIFVVDLWGMSANTITLLALVGGHILQVGGILMWANGLQFSRNRNHTVRNLFIALSILSLLMTISSLYHSWVLSMVEFLLILVFLFTTVGYSIGMPGKPSS